MGGCASRCPVLVTLVGIEKIVPSMADLEVFLQLLPRSATGERMNPYNSIWTGTRGVSRWSRGVPRRPARQRSHQRPGRSGVARDTHCIRCAACLNACPVYRQTGGHAYGSIYSGPIGAILTPQLQSMEHSTSLPYASSLCGACYEVCPVKINIPEILIHLRRRIVEADPPRGKGSRCGRHRWHFRVAAGCLSRSGSAAWRNGLSSMAGRSGRFQGRLPDGRRRGICLPFRHRRSGMVGCPQAERKRVPE